MASLRWKGKALTTAKVATVPVTAYDAATTYALSVNDKVFSVIAAGSVNATATALAAAWNASTEAEPSEVTASAATDTVTFTADTAGVEFTLVSSVSGGAGTIGAFTTTVANSSINDVAVATNWDTGTVPTAGDTVYVDFNDISLLWNLDQSGEGTVTTLQVNQSFTATIGLPEVNADGTPYPEHREAYYKLRTTNLVIGRGPGQGSGRLKIDSDTVQVAAVIENTGSGLESDIPAMLWKGTHAANTLLAQGNAQVGVAFFLGEVATIATLTVKENATVAVGAGTTLAVVVVYGGTVTINCAISTSITMYGGDVTINGTGAVAAAFVYGGTLHYNTTGTLGGAPVVGEAGLIDFSGDARAKVVTNPIDASNTNPVNDPNQVVGNLRIDYNGLAPVEALGRNVRLTRGTPA